jgi:hypothetical protein
MALSTITAALYACACFWYSSAGGACTTARFYSSVSPSKTICLLSARRTLRAFGGVAIRALAVEKESPEFRLWRRW